VTGFSHISKAHNFQSSPLFGRCKKCKNVVTPIFSESRGMYVHLAGRKAAIKVYFKSFSSVARYQNFHDILKINASANNSPPPGPQTCLQTNQKVAGKRVIESGEF
jgi:hypothetical protein